MEQLNADLRDTIAAISTPPGTGGIAVVRLSGPDAITVADAIWRGKPLGEAPSHTAHLGNIIDVNGQVLDQCVATVFRAPRTFTGQDTVEFSVHGSQYIQHTLLGTLQARGARMAGPGEFTRRAFANGRLDLARAEAVADVIAATSRAAHRLAMQQLRGGFSKRIDELRERLVRLAALLELELDFSEEDVTFADREQLASLTEEILGITRSLADTFRSGDAIKNGIPVAIVGAPNAGKSCLLNTLLGSDRAIVSDIAGTTRDTIEDTAQIGGMTFRFIDTAGLRHTDDPIERLGIDRTLSTAARADIILLLVDPTTPAGADDRSQQLIDLNPDATLITVTNKTDLRPDAALTAPGPAISAKTGAGIAELRTLLADTARRRTGTAESENIIVTNARHHRALCQAAEALERTLDGLRQGQYTDLIAQDLRQALHHLGTITGAITTDTLLHSIFSHFCIGK